MTSEAKFLENIGRRLGRPMPDRKPDHPFRGAPRFWHDFALTPEERIAWFAKNWGAAGGHIVRLPSVEKAKTWICEEVTARKAKTILLQNQTELRAMNLEEALPEVRIAVWDETPVEEWKPLAAEADIGLIVADGAAAYTGTIVTCSSPQKGRSVSLLPPVLFAVVHTRDIRTRLGEIMTSFGAMTLAELPAGVHFISGPSRSSDIENDLTIGVHGPGTVYALIVGEE